MPDQGLAAVPGTWLLGARDFLSFETGEIVAFRVRSNGVISSYPGGPVPIPDGTGEFAIVGVIVGNDDADLSALAISAGALDPAFDPATTAYSATVGNEVSSIDVTATLSDPLATLTIEGTPADSGVAEAVPLVVGANTIDVVVTAENGVSEQTYSIVVTRELSGDATLSDLAIDAGTLGPVFDPATVAYTATVGFEVESIDVTATTGQPGSTLEIAGQAATSGVPKAVALPVGDTEIEVAVTAPDGIETATYIVTVTREAPDTTLTNLELGNATLTPAFDPATIAYTATVANDLAFLAITAWTSDSEATLTLNGSPTNSGSGNTPALVVGDNAIDVAVTGRDAVSQTIYTVTVTRLPLVLSTDATLSALSIDPGVISPAFDPATMGYTADVGNDVTSVNVTATRGDTGASMTVDGTPTSGAAVSVPLSVGANAIDVIVTAEDGIATETYTVTVTRAAPGPSTDATLSALSLSAGTLSPPFAPGMFGYTANVTNATTSVDVTATTNDAGASFEIDGSPAANGVPETVALAVGPNVIEVIVTAEDGVATETYTVTVTRAAPPAVDDATLTALSLSSGMLSPTFDPATLDYTSSVANGVGSVVVTATPTNPASTVEINGGADTTVPLVVGANVIEVVVTAEDGVATETYTVTVNRAAPRRAAAPSGRRATAQRRSRSDDYPDPRGDQRRRR